MAQFAILRRPHLEDACIQAKLAESLTVADVSLITVSAVATVAATKSNLYQAVTHRQILRVI